MKFISEKTALEKLEKLSADFRRHIKNEFEYKAKDCSVCQTPGSCCKDEHFVNVQISKLEAVHIFNEIEKLPIVTRTAINERIRNTADDLKKNPENETFACPLYENNIGCIIHDAVKPVPCVQHACYENREDLPPDEIQFEQERAIARLNRSVYGKDLATLPLPLALANKISIAD